MATTSPAKPSRSSVYCITGCDSTIATALPATDSRATIRNRGTFTKDNSVPFHDSSVSLTDKGINLVENADDVTGNRSKCIEIKAILYIVSIPVQKI